MPIFSNDDDAPPVPPVRPAIEDCCNSGCNPCILDRYEEEVERYRNALRAWAEKKKKREGER